MGASLVADVERWANVSRKLEPDFREGAATGALGHLLRALAPASWLECTATRN